jgi:integrase
MKGCRPPTDEEVILLQQSFGGIYADRDKALSLLGVKSGFRISQLLSLRLGDVSPHGHLVDRVTGPRRHMKREWRTVLLHPVAKAALADRLLTLRQTPGCTAQTFIFRSRKGTNRPISTVQAWRIPYEAVTASELVGKLGTHAMRKTFANRVYHQLNHNLVKTQRALGHKHINSTVAYLSFVEDEIDQAILASLRVPFIVRRVSPYTTARGRGPGL